MTENFDIAVIGAGPGGYVAAIRAAQLGMKTVIIEKQHLGGICLNWGCIPTKTLLKSAEINHLLKNAEEYGFTIKEATFDFAKIIERSRKVSKQLSTGIAHLLKKNKIKVIDAHAKLEGKNKISFKGKENGSITANNIIIATGARAKILPGFEPDGKIIWTYKEAMTPTALPKKLAVVGSGAIGIEFASFYHNMGVEVTVIEYMDRILPVEDNEISDFARKSFEKQGIKIVTSASVKKISKENNTATLYYDKDNKQESITVDAVIMAIGITANTEELGLENTAIKLDRNHIITNEWSETAEKNIYAIGDVAGAPWLAHKASHEAVICVEKIAALKNIHPLNKNNIPGCTYCYPQIASVGLTENKAKELGYKIKIGKFPFIANGKAIALGETEGFVKTIFDEKTGELLGAHMIGAEVTEMIQGYVVGKTMEATEEDFMHTIFPHPTLSEMMHESVLDAFKKAIHI
jgi:dihydrolipoamide dehydrogenase